MEFHYLLILVSLPLVYLLHRCINSHTTLPSNGKLVLITGCDTGFGNMTARKLDSLGYKVLAGCLTEKGMRELKEECSSKIIPFIINVTKMEDIEASVDLVKKHGDGKLWGLVNNAGISKGVFAEWTPSEVYQEVFSINFFAHVNVTKAHISSLVNAKGRVVNLSSCAAMIADPSMNAYSSSKYAFEGFSDGLRRELNPFGVLVSIIQPSFMKTAILGGVADWASCWNQLPKEIKQKWGEDWFQWNSIERPKLLSTLSEDPVLVVDDIVHALTNSNPHLRYHPGYGSKLFWLMSMLPAPWVDFLLRTFNRSPKPASLRN